MGCEYIHYIYISCRNYGVSPAQPSEVRHHCNPYITGCTSTFCHSAFLSWLIDKRIESIYGTVNRPNSKGESIASSLGGWTPETYGCRTWNFDSITQIAQRCWPRTGTTSLETAARVRQPESAQCQIVPWASIGPETSAQRRQPD
jgi:hypothetical protein